MLRLSKKADYALMAMKHLAVRPDAASASAREIAEAYDIPVELMAKVLQRLVRRGLLVSHQGTRGGYRLSRADLDDLGRRRHPGDRRPADGDRLLDRSGELRPVPQVQHPRSRSGGSRIASSPRWRPVRCRRCRRTCRSKTPARRSLSLSRDDRDSPARLSRLSRHHSRRSACARGDAPVLHGGVREPREPAARLRLEGRGGRRGGARPDRRRSSARSPREIVFTSGATESNNLALKGCADGLRTRGDHIVTVATEHKSVLDSCKRLEAQGWRVTRLGVHADGLIDLDELRKTVTGRDGTRVGHGRQQRDRRAAADGRDRAESCTRPGSLLHTDAAQAAGKVVDRRRTHGRRPALADGTQVLRSERRGRALRAETEAEDCSSDARSTAAGTRTACAPARSTSPVSWGLERRQRSARRRCRQRVRDSPRCATDCSPASAPNLDGVRVNGSMEHRLPAQPARQLRRSRRRRPA